LEKSFILQGGGEYQYWCLLPRDAKQGGRDIKKLFESHPFGTFFISAYTIYYTN